jgi:hypothetical protein
MLFLGRGTDEGIREHAGYLAGRYPDGTLSDSWTDATRRTPGTFTAFVAVCGCGWRGPARPPTEAGARRSQREWTRQHLLHVVPTRHVRSGQR